MDWLDTDVRWATYQRRGVDVSKLNIVNRFGSSILLEMNFLFQVLDRQEDQIMTEV